MRPDAKPCDCAFKGHDICKDPDGRGLLSPYDNCRFVYNPGQANCDGDAYGDACDSLNVRVTADVEAASTPSQATGATRCVGDPYGPNDVWSEFAHTTTKKTYEVRSYCGPSGYGVDRILKSRSQETGTCWQWTGGVCNGPGGSDPTPYCRAVFEPW